MQFLKNILLSIYKKPSLYFFIFIIIFTVDRSNRWFDYNKGNFPFVHDVDQYYSYLPAVFINHDLSFKFPNSYWTEPGKEGNKISKVTVGMAIMYSPFFLIGHQIAKSRGYNADGYSLPYKWCIHIGSILFSLFGLWFCRKNLLFFFSELITFITLICIFFGTNLFYYTYGHGEMPHAYLFFIFSLFIFLTLKWRDTKSASYLFGFSFLAGFATLIRPTECLILLFPFLLGVINLSNLRERIKELREYRFSLILAVVLFISPFFLQMVYWKTFADQWLFFSYGSKERFFFGDPQILNFLFSFRKGWLLYTPMMIFAIVGIFILFKKMPGLFYSIFLFLLVNIYLLSSWWDWPFGGSFGCRPLIHHYAFFAFGFAAFTDFVFNSFKDNSILAPLLKSLLCIVFYLLINLNLKQSWQYKYGIIHYNGMTKDAYLYVLNKDKLSDEEVKELRKKIRPVNVEAMRQGYRNE